MVKRIFALSSYKIDFLNPEGHQNQWFKNYGDFSVTVDLPIGGASAVEGLGSTGLPPSSF